jgi:HSP20 family protein
MAKSHDSFDPAASLLRGLGDLIDKLSDLAEAGEKWKEAGLKRGDVSATVGFRVRMAGRDREVKIEPFATRREEPAPREPARHEAHGEVRAPLVDVFDEEGYVQIVAEMPGTESAEAALEPGGRELVLRSTAGPRRYEARIGLARPVTGEPRVTVRNGIVEVRCEWSAGEPGPQ